MPGKRHQGHGHHKGYRGPWPEDHSAIPGRQAEQTGGDKARPEGGPHPPQVQKIPQQAPKPK